MSFIISVFRHNGVVLASAGTMAVCAVVLMHSLLKEYRDESEVKPVPPKTQYITQDTEDSLTVSTLNALLDHYNFSIRETAAKIVCDRASNDPAVFRTLLYGIARPDYDERMKNLRALALITDFSMSSHVNPHDTLPV